MGCSHGQVDWLRRSRGTKYVGKYWSPGWKRPLDFYSFVCEKHGQVVGYGAGYDGRLVCPLCAMELAFEVNKDVKIDR